MKHFSFFIFLFSFLLAACTKEEITLHEQGTIQKSFSLSIEEPEDAPKSRAEVTMSRYLLEMYEGDLNAAPLRMNNATGEFQVTLKKGVDYVCLFWADDNASYNADDLKAVTATDETALGTAAYCTSVTVTSKSSGAITLKRAVAELSFIDKNGLTEEYNTLKVTYPYASAALNVGEGTVSYATGETTRTITDIAPPTQATDAFATDFILAPTAKGQLEGLKFQLNKEEEKTLAAIALQANFRTKITGEYQVLLPSVSFTINTTKNTDAPDDNTFILPLKGIFTGYNLTVDWGDGEIKTFNSGTTLLESDMTHIYAKGAGEYTITITSTQLDPTQQQMPKLNFYDNYRRVANNPAKLISLNSPLLNMGENLSNCFRGCMNLTGAIPADLFAKNTEATSFLRCFLDCRNLTGAIPVLLFEKNTKATNFSACFYGCRNLTGAIPELLFAKNTFATDFSGCFSYCRNLTGAIPADLFAKNTEATDFSACFLDCTGLTSIPEQLFAENAKATNFSNCFYSCRGLSEIPEQLFAENTAATNFGACFNSCRGLREIPVQLFAKNATATDFGSCFSTCTGLTSIPEQLFAENAKATSFGACFNGCTGLREIPVLLFAKNIAATSFGSCFNGCTNLASIPADLFAKNTKATDFTACFRGCTGLTEIPAELFTANTAVTNFTSCFWACTGLTAVPELLFEKNTLATNFSSCFNGCTKLVLNANIFCDETAAKNTRFAGKKMNFSSCFYNCGSDLTNGTGGIAPALWDYTMTVTAKIGCFYNVTKVTNVNDIDFKWK